MNKTIRTILCIAIFAVLAVSCQKGIGDIEPVTNAKETIEISVNGLMGEYTQVDATKASIVNNVRVSWDGGETVYVLDGVKCLGSLLASLDGDEDRYALLSTDGDSHTIMKPTEGTTKLTLVYSPLLTKAPEVNEGAISISLADQSGTKAPFVAYATLDYNNEESITDVLVPFKFATSVIKVNCTGLAANTAIENATLSNVNTACKLTLSGSGAPTVAGDVIGTITKTGDTYFSAEKVDAEGEAVFQMAVPELEAASEARYLTIIQGSLKKQDKKFTTKSLNAATSVNTVCQLAGPPIGGLFGEFSVSDSRKVYFSSGILYSSLYSEFFFEENQYDSSSGICYPFWIYYGGGNFLLAYYNEVQYDINTPKDVFYTNNGVTSSRDDFTVNIGGEKQRGWRTLSSDELKYLFNTRTVNGGTGNGKSYSLNITYGGKMGLVIYPDDYTGEPLNSMVTVLPDGVVFLPALGQRDGDKYSGDGKFGCYWASNTYFSREAYSLYFTSDEFQIKHTSRALGGSVRLVTDVK